MISPVALFSYNRFSTLKKTLECLKRNYLADQTDIFIFSDGPKDLEDYSSILDIRKYIKKIEGFKKIILIERELNFGLSKNIVSGIDHVLEENNSVIVLEDDILTSKYFLEFMNDALSDNTLKKHNFFNIDKVKFIKDNHEKNIENNASKLWALIQFNLWYEKNF